MKIASKYNHPTIVGRLNEDGYVRGSIRGLQNSELTDFKSFLQDTDLFEYVQGHAQAAGESILATNIPAFHKIANEKLGDMNFNENYYEVEFERTAAASDLIPLIMDIGGYTDVWGTENPEPKIFIKDLNFNKEDIQVIGKNSDTLRIQKFGVTYIKFHAKELIEELETLDSIKMNFIGKMNINEWNGIYTPQIFIDEAEILDGTYGF